MAAPALLNAAMPGSHRKRCAGFSILEVLVASGLIVIVMSIAVSRFSGLRGPFAARQAARQVASEFQAARMRAIASNSSVRLVYSSSPGGEYRLQRQSGGNWQTEKRNQLPTGVTVSGIGDDPPQFGRTGTLNANYTLTVNAYGSTRTVTINVLGQTTIS